MGSLKCYQSVNVIKLILINKSQITLLHLTYIRAHLLVITSQLLSTVSLCPTVITLSGFHCKKETQTHFKKGLRVFQFGYNMLIFFQNNDDDVSSDLIIVNQKDIHSYIHLSRFLFSKYKKL